MQGQIVQFFIGCLQGPHKSRRSCCQMGIHQRQDQPDGQNHEGCKPDRHRKPGIGTVLQRSSGHFKRKPGGRHTGIVHPGDRRTHDQCAEKFFGEIRNRSIGTEGGDDPKSRGGGRNSDQNRQKYQKGVVADAHRHLHRHHPGIVHRPDPQPHQSPGHQKTGGADPGKAGHPESEPGNQDRHQKRQHGYPDIIVDRKRHPVRQHADEVHGPDAGTHGNGPPPSQRRRIFPDVEVIREAKLKDV